MTHIYNTPNPNTNNIKVVSNLEAPESKKVNLELLKAIELDKCRMESSIYDITGNPLLDQPVLKEMNKNSDFVRLALYDNINCLEYFARYKESINKLDMVLMALVRTPQSTNPSNIEKTSRFMAAYGLEVNTIMHHVNLYEVPLFYLVCISTQNKDIIWDLLEQKPDLNAKVILRDGSRVETAANNIDEFFNHFSSVDNPEHVATAKEVINNYKLKLLKDDLNSALAPQPQNTNTIKI